jgi:hypothetical protein
MRAARALAVPEIRLAPETGAALVQALYRDVTIASRCLVAGGDERFLVGASPEVDAPAPDGGEEAHPLVTTDARGIAVGLAPAMTGEIVFEDHALPLPPGDLVLSPGAQLRLRWGAMAYLVVATSAPPRLPRPRRRWRGAWADLVSAAALLVFGLFLSFLPPPSKSLSLDSLSVLAHQSPVIVIPRALPPAPAGGQARPAAPAAARTRPVVSRGARIRSAPRRPDPEDAGHQGILGTILSHPGASWQSFFSRQGLLDEGEVLRDLQGTTLEDSGVLRGVTVGAGIYDSLIGDSRGPGLGPCLGCRAAAGDALAHLGPRAPIVPEVRAGAVTTQGSLDKEIVRRIIRRHVNEIRYCYEQELARHPSLAGRVVTQFSILPDGRVGTALLAASTVDDVRVQACILAAVRRWEFPVPRGGGLVMVSYPFLLVPAGP